MPFLFSLTGLSSLCQLLQLSSCHWNQNIFAFYIKECFSYSSLTALCTVLFLNEMTHNHRMTMYPWNKRNKSLNKKIASEMQALQHIQYNGNHQLVNDETHEKLTCAQQSSKGINGCPGKQTEWKVSLSITHQWTLTLICKQKLHIRH